MAAEQLDLATRTLSSVPEGASTAIHETRKAIKRLRTIDRLLESTLDGKRRKRRKKALREAAEALSSARDAEVSAATLEATIASGGKRLRSDPGVTRLLALLDAERSAAEREHSDGAAGDMGVALAALRRIDADPQRGSRAASGRAVSEALAKIYSRGRRAMRRALKTKDAADMHEWRKRVKDLRYATEALSPADGKRGAADAMRKLARRADKLGEALGEEHDLAIIDARVKAERALFEGDEEGRKALLRAVSRRRKRLRRQAAKLGKELYEERPKRFAKRMRRAIA